MTVLLCAFTQLYLVVIFCLAGRAHPDDDRRVFAQGEWRKVGRLLWLGGDGVLDLGCAFDREEVGARRCTSEHKNTLKRTVEHIYK